VAAAAAAAVAVAAAAAAGAGATGAAVAMVAPAGAVTDTACLVRRQDNASAAGRRVRALNALWWRELKGQSVRDQISFPYAAWKLGA
jgi:hypothetical protein